MSRMPVLAPFWRKQKLRTGGRLPLRGVGKIKSFSADRVSPVKGHRLLGLGSLKNSGVAGAADRRAAWSGAVVVLAMPHTIQPP